MSGSGQPRSVQNSVNLRGKPCALRRHFRGYPRQVIAFLDMLASRDPERFVWAGWESIQKHARKWPGKTTSMSSPLTSTPGSKPKKPKRAPRNSACRSEIYFCLNVAKQHGIIEEAKRFRNGAMREGYIVTAHDDVAIAGEQTCTMFTTKQPLIGHQFGHQFGHYFGHQIGHHFGHHFGQNGDTDRTVDWTKDWTPKSAQSSDTAREMSNTDVVLYVGSDVGLQGANPVNPVNLVNFGNPESTHSRALRSALGERTAAIARQYCCYAEFPKGRIWFTLSEARLLIDNGWVSAPDENGKCAVIGCLDLEAITDEATWAAEYDCQNADFEEMANWFAYLDAQHGPVCLPRRDRLDVNPRSCD